MSRLFRLLAIALMIPALAACMGSNSGTSDRAVESTLDTDVDGDGLAAGNTTN